MIENIGWLGAVLLAICGAPEAYSALKNKKTGLGFPLLILWLGGEVFTLIYLIFKSTEISLLPLFFNYGLNLIFIIIIMTVKLKQTKEYLGAE